MTRAHETAQHLDLPGTQWRIADVALQLFAPRQVLQLFATGHAPCVGAVAEAEPISLEACIDLQENGAGTLWLDDRPTELLHRDPTGAYALALLLTRVAAASRTCLFFHASAAAIHGSAALVTGPSGHGKSTLGRALQEIGALALADDVTAVRCDRGTVLSGNGHIAGGEIPVSDVFVLRLPGPGGNVRLAVDHFPRNWHTDPPWPPGYEVKAMERKNHWEITCEGAPEHCRGVLAESLQRHGVYILRDLSIDPACFGQIPKLSRIPAAEALPAIVAEVFGRRDKSIGAVAMAVAAALRNARFWLLKPGTPGQTAEMVYAFVQDNKAAHNSS